MTGTLATDVFLLIAIIAVSITGFITSKRIDILNQRVEMLERIHLLPHTHDDEDEQ